MEKSRLISIDLGYDYISTIHFFIADCILDNKYSIKQFLFKNTGEFQAFYKAQQIAETTIFGDLLDDSLPLTKEAEKTMRKGIDEQKKYKSEKLYPYHIFLAASQIEKSLFRSIITPKDTLHLRLIEYYKGQGLVLDKPKQGFLQFLNRPI